MDRRRLIVRRLPPRLTREGFEKLVNNAEITYIQGKEKAKNIICSRAYLVFKNHEELLSFYRAFNNHVFMGKDQKQYIAQVEYAPNPNFVETQALTDPEMGKVEETEDYKRFLEDLEKPPVEQTDDFKIEKDTPLIQFLRERASAPKKKKKKRKKKDRLESGVTRDNIDPTAPSATGAETPKPQPPKEKRKPRPPRKDISKEAAEGDTRPKDDSSDRGKPRGRGRGGRGRGRARGAKKDESKAQ